MSKVSKWLRKDDRVIVIAGNNKGKVGVVLAKNGTRILVQGVNVRKKHLKRRDENSKSDIIDIETPIDVSNVKPCTLDGQGVKLKARVNAQGEKELFYNLEGKEGIYRTLKTAKN